MRKGHKLKGEYREISSRLYLYAEKLPWKTFAEWLCGDTDTTKNRIEQLRFENNQLKNQLSERESALRAINRKLIEQNRDI